MKKRHFLFAILLLLMGVGACFYLSARPVRVDFAAVAGPEFADDLPAAELITALEKNLEYLRRLPAEQVFAYGEIEVEVARVLKAQTALRDFLRAEKPDQERLQAYLSRHFQCLEPRRRSLWPGRPTAGEALFTGYYVPTLKGSLKPDARYAYPLFKRPPDLVSIDLEPFNLQRQVLKIWPWLDRLPLLPGIEELRWPRLRGRLTEDGRVVPYFTRQEIDQKKLLASDNQVLVWVDDPVDSFFLHIQGSGRIELADGSSMMLGYAAANGHPYRSVGAWLIRKGLMRREEVTMPSIRAWIKANPERRDEIFAVNPSYVFFRELPEGEPLGCFQTALTAGRSVALDRRVYPGGALLWIDTKLPLFDENGRSTGERPCQRLVVNQDTGGAIRGPFRLDLYCGSDENSALTAGHLKARGKLGLLLPLQ